MELILCLCFVNLYLAEMLLFQTSLLFAFLLLLCGTLVVAGCILEVLKGVIIEAASGGAAAGG